MARFLSTDPKHLKHLFCGCGKAAEQVWMTPPAPKKGPGKMSKSDKPEEKLSEEPQVYGWACNNHVPPGVP